MSQRVRLKVLAIRVSILALLAATALLLTTQRLGADSSSTTGPTTTQRIVVSGWRVDGAFVSTIQIRNNLVTGPQIVSLSLYMADGTEYQLPPTQITAGGIAQVNVNDALRAAPESLQGHLSQFGSAAITYTYPVPGTVHATIENLDVRDSLIYPFLFVRAVASSPLERIREGLWWKHDSGVTGFVFLSNTIDAPREVQLQGVGSGGETLGQETVSLGAHSTQIIDLEKVVGHEPRVGGVSVRYTGGSADVLVNGGLENIEEGYSANIPFRPHELTGAPSTFNIASVGIMVGEPDPAMGFPAGTAFKPYAAMRNTSDAPMEIALSAYTMQNGQPRVANLWTVKLEAHHAKQLSLVQLLASAGLGGYSGLLTLSFPFTGRRGDLVIATGTVDQTGNFAFTVPPQGVGPSIQQQETLFWSLADGNDAMYTLWNSGATTEDIVVTFTYVSGGQPGQYQIPLKLTPGAQEMLDIGQIIATRQPDSNGDVFPSNVTDGGATFAGPGGRQQVIHLSVASGVFNVREATCHPICTQCSGATSLFLSPDSLGLDVGGSAQTTATLEWSDGATLNITKSAGWSSSNTGVATASAGLVTGMGAGSCDITASFDAEANIESCGVETPQCPVIELEGGGGACVGACITSISPTQGLVGTPVGVTITGSGFGTNAMVNAGPNIVASVNQPTADTLITATFVISPAASGPQTVTVQGSSSEGSNGPGNSATFFVQVPTHLARIDEPGTPTNGMGPLITGTNINVLNLDGSIRAAGVCGGYQWFTYGLADQVGNQIKNGTVTFTESFSNISPSPDPLPPPPSGASAAPNLATQVLSDILAIFSTAPQCPPANVSDSFDQHWTATLGTTTYDLTTVIHITRALNGQGLPTFTSTITTP